jgi:hypothetical protein
MAQGVVELLELVQVQHHQPAVLLGAFAGFHRLFQPVEQQATVGQHGERVEVCQAADFFLGCLALGNVMQGDALAQVVSGIVEQGRAV